jgi:DNA-binding MarR family transcriptional regulator
VILRSPDQEAIISALVETPALARRLYRRGGFDALEPNALQVLVALFDSAPMTVGALADSLVLGQGTVSTALSVLSKRGLVQGKPDPDDRRRQLQRITRSGAGVVRRFVADTQHRLQADTGFGAQSSRHA